MKLRSIATITLQGLAAGFLATIPMTLFMLAMQQLLPRWQRYALPPEKLVEETTERADMPLAKSQQLTVSLISHFAYGSLTGAAYALLQRSLPLPSFLKGMLFGVLVWAASYLGWIPVAGFSIAAPREPLPRNLLMIAAHLIWGSTAGLLTKQLLLSKDQ